MDIIKELNRIKTDKHKCLGCGYERNFTIKGCAIINQAIEELKKSKQSCEVMELLSQFSDDKNEPIELYKLGQSLDVVISKVTFEDKQIHVITKTYDQYLENLEKYNIEVDKQEKEFKKAKDNSRVKKHLGRRSKSYLKKQGKPSRGHYGKKARK